MSDTIAKLRELLLHRSKAGMLRGLLDQEQQQSAPTWNGMLGGLAGAPSELPYKGTEMTPERIRNGLSGLVDMTPVVGDIKSGIEGVQAAREGDWAGAGLGMLGALPMVPNLAGAIKKVGSKEMEQLLKYGQEADDYLYHVAPLSSVKRIMSEGLQPRTLGRPSTFESPAYRQHGLGKAFLTDRDGVPYWMDRVENSLFHSYDNPPPVRIVKVPKKDIKSQLLKDEIGTADANHPAWYVTETIPPK